MRRSKRPATQPTLTDGVVALRPWHAADIDAIVRACQDVDIQRYTRVPVPYLRENAVAFISAFPWSGQLTDTGVSFAVVDAARQELLGACALVRVDVAERRAEVGYWTAPWGRRREATVKAVRLLTDWALTEGGLVELIAKIENENVASLRVAAGAGFRTSEIADYVEEHRGAPRTFSTVCKDAPTL